MKNPYYLLWSDAITRFRKHHPDRADWKLSSFLSLTWVQALNLWTICIWLQYFELIQIKFAGIDIFPGSMINGFLDFSITFFLPFVPINYFLIFYKNRYEKIIGKYKNIKYQYALIYSLLIALLALFSAILYGILT